MEACILQLTPCSWAVQEDFVDAGGRALSDHQAIAVRFVFARP